MNDEKQSTTAWAPWWHYVVAVVAVNAVAQAVGLREVDTITNIVTTVILVVATATLVTLFYRRGYGAQRDG